MMKKVAFFLYSLSGGGTERVNLLLANELSNMGYLVDLILVKKDGKFIDKVSSNIKIIDLHKGKAIESIYSLAKYIFREKPEIIFTAFPTINIIGIFANILIGFKTKIIPTEHMPVSIDAKENNRIEPKIAYKLYPFFYFFVKRIVLVSKDAADDFIKTYKLINRKKVEIIYNPVVSEDLIRLSRQVPRLSWFNEAENKKPIIIGIGRLTKQKNFQLLIKAFAEVKAEYDCRLVILGEGEEQYRLRELAKKLKIENDILMPGFVENPYACLSRSSVFVLSSIYEQLPTVLIEALGCGIPVVATNCFGVREILQNGKYGIIVENATVHKMAEAIKNSLYNVVDKKGLLERANFFKVQKAAKKYSDLIEEICSQY